MAGNSIVVEYATVGEKRRTSAPAVFISEGRAPLARQDCQLSMRPPLSSTCLVVSIITGVKGSMGCFGMRHKNYCKKRLFVELRMLLSQVVRYTNLPQ